MLLVRGASLLPSSIQCSTLKYSSKGPISVAGSSFVNRQAKFLYPKNGMVCGQKRAVSDKKDLPISPHVTIYRFPLPAITSITHRVAGVCLTLAAIDVGLLGLFGPHFAVDTIWSIKNALNPLALSTVKLGVAFPLTYHYINGLRHLVWDSTAKYLDLESVNSSSQIIIGVSAIISFIIALC